MRAIYLTESDVRQLLPMKDCIGRVRDAFASLATGEAINQPRRRLTLPTRSTLHYMAGSDGAYFGIKVYSTNPHSTARFLLMLYRAADAALVAIMEANYLGQIRTGAASAVASALLARQVRSTLGIIGSGFQARSQVEALATAIDVKEVLVWSRSVAKRNAFARETDGLFGVPVRAVDSAEEAVTGGDVLVTATTSKEPVLDAKWVKPGTHINAMGSNNAQRRELPADLIARADLVSVDDLEQSRMESGDLLLALRDNDWSRVVELKQLIVGPSRRIGPTEISVFKSNGAAVEDVSAAKLVYEKAIAAGIGQPFYS